MRTMLLILTTFALKPDFSSSPPSFYKIMSRHYSLIYSKESSPFVAFDSAGKLIRSDGVINRNENYEVSKSDSNIGILEDSAFFYMDAAQRMMTIGPKSSVGALLIQPLCDPYEIINYAINNKMGFQKHAEDGKLTYEFVGLKHDDPIYNISLSFYDDHPDSFSIKFIYQQYPLVKQDIVRYRFAAPSAEKTRDMIADFLDFKNGKFEPKQAYEKYFFVNAFLLLRKE